MRQQICYNELKNAQICHLDIMYHVPNIGNGRAKSQVGRQRMVFVGWSSSQPGQAVSTRNREVDISAEISLFCPFAFFCIFFFSPSKVSCVCGSPSLGASPNAWATAVPWQISLARPARAPRRKICSWQSAPRWRQPLGGVAPGSKQPFQGPFQGLSTTYEINRSNHFFIFFLFSIFSFLFILKNLFYKPWEDTFEGKEVSSRYPQYCGMTVYEVNTDHLFDEISTDKSHCSRLASQGLLPGAVPLPRECTKLEAQGKIQCFLQSGIFSFELQYIHRYTPAHSHILS